MKASRPCEFCGTKVPFYLPSVCPYCDYRLGYTNITEEELMLEYKKAEVNNE